MLYKQSCVVAKEMYVHYVSISVTYDLHGHLVSVRGSVVERSVPINVARERTVPIQVTKEVGHTTVGGKW